MNKGKVVLVTLGAVVAVILVVVVTYGLQWGTAGPRGAIKAREQIVGSGEFRKQAYDHFFDLCSGIQAQEDRLLSLKTELDTTNPSPRRTDEINASMTAIRNQRAEAVRQYNADATRNYTVGQFRDSDLPYHIDITDEETECAI